MEWIDVTKELPPCDGNYEVTKISWRFFIISMAIL